MYVKSLSRVRLSATPWTVAYQAPPSIGFSRQEYWSGLLFSCMSESCIKAGGFPGSPVVKTSCSQCRGHGFDHG